MLRSENVNAIASFIFEDILCCQGALAEIVTDNGPVFIKALDTLGLRYHINHIQISPYNSQANRIVEHHYYDVHKALIKSCDREELHWYKSAPSVFWAEHVTLHKATGLSPYFMAHGIEPLFPFDLAQATFLVPPPESNSLDTTALITFRTCQLQKRGEDINSIHEKVLKSRFQSIKQFEQTFKNHIKDYNFAPGSLVLVQNT
ncbi:hypothetical protein PAXINDRAFT_64763 [Paxillus involutus ATCC 200175]|nr:hypothetical protein PAXINDRAFT_64763 [Paxillus involutus ATCC 200175]